VPRHHHVNVGVPPGGLEAQSVFLVDILGYSSLDPPEELRDRAHWFQADDGSQVHLSEDPDHRPAGRAHIAIDCGTDLPMITDRLNNSGLQYRTFDGPTGTVTVFCQDPAGNRWELRGPSST
jgi:catechol 2,3-dioxygenase-like lactoylglutathione lyase family enzyme